MGKKREAAVAVLVRLSGKRRAKEASRLAQGVSECDLCGIYDEGPECPLSSSNGRPDHCSIGCCDLVYGILGEAPGGIYWMSNSEKIPAGILRKSAKKLYPEVLKRMKRRFKGIEKEVPKP